MNFFAIKIKRAREERQLYQKHIAKALGVSVAYYASIEQGLKYPSPPQWMELVRILSLSYIEKRDLEAELLKGIKQIRINVSTLSIQQKTELFNKAIELAPKK